VKRAAVMLAPAAQVILSLWDSDILRRRRKVIFYLPSKLRGAQYHAAQAAYHCEAISLAAGE